MADAQGKPQSWPTIRKGINVAFSDYDLDGKPQWLIHDAGRNKFFLIGWLEYEIFERWGLANLDAIINSIKENTTLNVEKEDIENFYQFLRRSYLLNMSGYEINRQAAEQQLFKSDSWVHWLIGNYLFFRIPILNPDKFLTRTRGVVDIIFSHNLAYFMCALGLVALYQLSNRWDQFIHTFSSIFTWEGLFFSMIAFMIGKLCHELGHAYRTKQYGVSVPSLGLAFLVFWPVLYTDTTLSWSLTSGQRMRISMAGVWMETYLAIFAVLIWCNTDNQTIQTICYVMIMVNWLGSVLINASPFMRFDGYYILADYLKMPNLQFRAFALARWEMRRILFGWNDPPPEKFTPRLHYFLIGYSFFTWFYRLSLYVGIAVLVYHFFAKFVGIVLFLVELHFFILAPFVEEFKTWHHYKDKFTWNINTKITVSIASAIVILFFIPFNQTYKFPSTLRFAHEFVTAPEAGILINPLPPLETQVAANQPITIIRSAQLEQAIRETQLEYDKTMGQLRSSDVNTEFLDQKTVLVSDLKRLQAEYQKLLKLQDRLTLTVPFNGTLIEKSSELRPGDYVMKGEWLADVVQRNKVAIEAFVPQIDIKSIKKNETGYFYAFNYSIPGVPVHVISIEAMNANELDCSYSADLKQQKSEDSIIETPCYHASDLGGEIPAYLADNGNYEPTSAYYRVLLVADGPVVSNHVERGTVFLHTQPRSFASRFFYYVKSTLIEEVNF